jgi:dTDP-4-amino-4,6-dideoxygalactose transaminase
MIYYPVPLHLQKAYRYNYKEGDFPLTEKISEDIISLPMHTELTDDQIDYITSKVIEFVKSR